MILEKFLVTDRAAVVTGAGRGIGAATAVALAEAGADVVVSSRTGSQLAEVVAQVEATGRRAVAVEADLSDLDAAAGLADAARDAFGRLDIVVNNVGGAMPRAFTHTSPRYMEEAFHFNVSTAHALTRAAAPLLLASGNGAVVNISSVMGRVSGRGYVAYGTAKAALSHYTRLAARDLAPRVRVNAIGVGSVATSALELVLDDEATRTTDGAEHSAAADRRRHRHRRHRAVPGVGRRRVPHRQGGGGRRRPRPAQPGAGLPRPVGATRCRPRRW